VRTGSPAARGRDRAEAEKFFADFVGDLLSLSYPEASTLAQNLKLKRSFLAGAGTRQRGWLRSLGHRSGATIGACTGFGG
jgi:hypothetical protein